ncbi:MULTISPECIES: ATP-binding cassette domain-containing protein [Bacteroidota]|uniref:ATP-binding cassette domain-containing protein n=1 Tax=Bacteroidota TaxID=976 RepID=UPI00257BCAD4|nr:MULTISPECIES: ATP-binding cassette domain-containing protein [Bacteroidota]
MITVKNLSKKYGSKIILSDINLNFNRGEVHGIVGNNGAGKSTLFKCIAGIESYEGIVKSEFEKTKDHIGFLDTDPYFFPKITGEEYLRLLCHSRKVPEPNFEEKNIFDLPLGEYAANYSTGMKKKLAISGVMLQDNDYFIFDEPFNGLDLQSNIIVTALIHHLKELRKIVLISSHIFSTLHDCCDRIHFLKNGQVVKSTGKENFRDIEEEMKHLILGDKIAKLGLK